MAAAPGTSTRRTRRAVAISAGYVLIMVAVAVARGGIVVWVRWTAAAVAILVLVGLVVLSREWPRPPRPAGHDWEGDAWAEGFSMVVGMSSFVLSAALGATWQGDAPLLVLAGVLGSIPFLALMWWKVLRPDRTTGLSSTGTSPDDN